MMKHGCTAVVLFCAAVNSIWAQEPVFSVSTAAFSTLTASTPVMKDSVWDDAELWKPSERNITLGFTFKAFSRSITSFQWSDGAIIFKDGDTIIKIGTEADLCDYGYGGNTAYSSLSRKAEGTAGNRIVKLEWKKAGLWDEWSKFGNCSDSVTMQIWIHENPNKIEMRFGNSKSTRFGSIFPDGLGITCAKYDIVGKTSGIKLDGNPASPVTFEFKDTATHGLSAWPASGTVYTFAFSASSGTREMGMSNTRIWYADGILFTSGMEGKTLHFYAADGRKVLSEKVNGGLIYVHDVLPTGVYIICPDSGEFSAQKIVVD